MNIVFENFNLISETSHNPEKVFFNFPNHELSDDKKPLLCRGLNFSIPPKYLDYADYMLPFKIYLWTLIKIKCPLKKNSS